MKLVIGFFQFRDPLRPGAVEDELDIVMRVFELFHGFQRVHHTPQAFVRFRIGQNHNGDFRHRMLLC